MSDGKQRNGLYRHPRSGIYWTRFRHDGTEYRRSTRTRNHREAQKIAREIRQQVESEPQRPVMPAVDASTIETLAAFDIVEHQDRGFTGHDLRVVESRWTIILANCDNDTRVTDIDYDWLRAYEGRRRKAGIKGQTIVREFRRIRSALKIAKRKQVIASLPDEWPSVRKDAPDKNLSGKLRSPKIIAQFLRALHPDARHEIEFAFLTGMRSAELKRIEPDWVEPARSSGHAALLRVPSWASKTRSERVVGLSQRAVGIIKARLELDPKSPTVFSPQNFKKHYRETSRRMKLESTITLRDMRHTFATLALQASGDPAAVMAALGHKDLSTTERYLTSPLERTAGLAGLVEKHLEGYNDE